MLKITIDKLILNPKKMFKEMRERKQKNHKKYNK